MTTPDRAGTPGGAPGGPVVLVVLPRALEALAGDRRRLLVPLPADGRVGSVLAVLERDHPVLGRRVRDETGALRRFVNVYLDGTDVRRLEGTDTPVSAGQEVHIIQSVAGG